MYCPSLLALLMMFPLHILIPPIRANNDTLATVGQPTRDTDMSTCSWYTQRMSSRIFGALS